MEIPSIFRRWHVLRDGLRHPGIFLLGWREAYGDGRTYDRDPWSPKSTAYDAGRDLRRMGRA